MERAAARRTATSGRTTCATGASATRWTGPGRSASCRRASTGARRATPPSRCASSIADLQLIACGSSGTFMPTYLDLGSRGAGGVLRPGGRHLAPRLLRQHAGAGRATARRAILAMNLDMDRQIREIAAVCDYVQGLQKSSKRLWLSFDEWNVWYRARERQGDRRPAHGRAASARGGLQPGGRAARRRLRQHAAPQFGSRAGRRAWRSSST